MASEAGASIVIDRTIEDVWAYLNDPANDSQWRPIKHLRAVGDDPVGAGTRYEGTLMMLGREYPYTTEITQFDPPSRLAWKGLEATGWFIGREGSYSLAPEGGGARLTLYLSNEPISRAGRLLDGPLGSLLMRLSLPGLVKKIKSGAEGRARASG